MGVFRIVYWYLFAAPWGSPLILPISYTYIGMVGSQVIANASKMAIPNETIWQNVPREAQHVKTFFFKEDGGCFFTCFYDVPGLVGDNDKSCRPESSAVFNDVSMMLLQQTTVMFQVQLLLIMFL